MCEICMYRDPLRSNRIIESQQNVEDSTLNFSTSIVPADGLALLCAGASASKMMNKAESGVDSSYDQAQLRSIKMADARNDEFRQSRIVLTRYARYPYCTRREPWDRLISLVRKIARKGSDIADFGRRKFRRIDRNCQTRKYCHWP